MLLSQQIERFFQWRPYGYRASDASSGVSAETNIGQPKCARLIFKNRRYVADGSRFPLPKSSERNEDEKDSIH